MGAGVAAGGAFASIIKSVRGVGDHTDGLAAIRHIRAVNIEGGCTAVSVVVGEGTARRQQIGQRAVRISPARGNEGTSTFKHAAADCNSAAAIILLYLRGIGTALDGHAVFVAGKGNAHCCAIAVIADTPGIRAAAVFQGDTCDAGECQKIAIIVAGEGVAIPVNGKVIPVLGVNIDAVLVGKRHVLKQRQCRTGSAYGRIKGSVNIRIIGVCSVGCRHTSRRLNDRKLHRLRLACPVVIGFGRTGKDIIGARIRNCGVFINFYVKTSKRTVINGIRIRRIIVRHRCTLRRTVGRYKRQERFAHRAGRLGERYGPIGSGLVDDATNRKRFFACPELVLLRSFAGQRDFHSDGMIITHVRGIKRHLGGKVRSFCECKRIFAVCKRQVDWNRAAVRRAVIAALN